MAVQIQVYIDAENANIHKGITSDDLVANIGTALAEVPDIEDSFRLHVVVAKKKRFGRRKGSAYAATSQKVDSVLDYHDLDNKTGQAVDLWIYEELGTLMECRLLSLRNPHPASVKTVVIASGDMGYLPSLLLLRRMRFSILLLTLDGCTSSELVEYGISRNWNSAVKGHPVNWIETCGFF